MRKAGGAGSIGSLRHTDQPGKSWYIPQFPFRLAFGQSRYCVAAGAGAGVVDAAVRDADLQLSVCGEAECSAENTVCRIHISRAATLGRGNVTRRIAPEDETRASRHCCYDLIQSPCPVWIYTIVTLYRALQVRGVILFGVALA